MKRGEDVPGQFEYLTEKPSSPQGALNLYCRSWQHKGKATELSFLIPLDDKGDETDVSGLIAVRVAAENLMDPVSHQIPVRIKIEHQRSVEMAGELVEAICDSSG